MSKAPQESRTFPLDPEIVAGLCSDEDDTRTEAILRLPETMTRGELADVAIQVRLTLGVKVSDEDLKRGGELANDALFHIGRVSLFKRSDIVTAQNSARELRGRGLTGLAGFLILKTEIWGVKKDLPKSRG